MKIITSVIVIFFYILSNIGFSYASEKTLFVNVDYLIQNSNFGKKVLDKIEKQNKQNIEELAKKNKFLKDLELEIKNKKNVLSDNEFNNEVLSFQKKVQEFNNEKNIIVNEFNDFRKKEIENIFKTFNPILTKYMKENSINILLDSKNVFMGDVEANITNVILKEINNELK